VRGPSLTDLRMDLMRDKGYAAQYMLLKQKYGRRIAEVKKKVYVCVCVCLCV
jgi:hypothetical protein